ncbi:MAG: hypothetical protein ACK4N5_01865 [Myxococcales bacterium]
MLLLATATLLVQLTATRGTEVTVPVDVGVGPAALLITGPVFRDQPVHGALKLSIAAVLDKEFIRKNERRIPAKYRKMAKGVEEVRISPSIFIPDSLILSPPVRGTGLYGITFRPFSLGVPLLSGPVSFDLSAGLLLTYAFLHSDVLPTTHFLRPGIDLQAELEFQLSKSFLISLGWASGFYVPQQVGTFLSVGPLNDSMWHLGQGFLKFHFRFPYKVTL